MLGDVGPYWTILVGAVLLWVALDMLGVAVCRVSGGLMGRLKVKGLWGAFLLGLAYGVLSGSCTFGFIAPILAVITIQQKIATGVALVLLFAVGHCLPIVVAGSSTALVQRWLENSAMRGGGVWFRKSAGVLIDRHHQRPGRPRSAQALQRADAPPAAAGRGGSGPGVDGNSQTRHSENDLYGDRHGRGPRLLLPHRLRVSKERRHATGNTSFVHLAAGPF